MRVLGIETSSDRGTVALVEGGTAVASLARNAPGAHGEHLRSLVEEAFAISGWGRTSIDRIAVGVGPGSFTGLRVGVAFAEGAAIGLDRPIAGVGSLRAMSQGVPPENTALRCSVLDARRGDVFAAVHGPEGRARLGPALVERSAMSGWLAELGEAPTFVGRFAAELGLLPLFRSELTDLPHAVCVAQVGAEAREEALGVEATYLRAPDAIAADGAQISAIFRARP